MKKKILSGIFALTLLVTAGYGVNKGMKSDVNLSDLALNNVEALANGESGGYRGCTSGWGYCAIYLHGQLIFSSYEHVPFS
jgi:hypothetical protein